MAPQADLGKVGKEAFEMLEEYLARRGRAATPSFYHNTPPKKEPMMESTQAAREFGGALFVRHGGRSKFHRGAHVRFP